MYEVKKSGSKWEVRKTSGRVIGTFSKRKEATEELERLLEGAGVTVEEKEEEA